MGCDIHSFYEIKKEGKWVRGEERLFTGYDNKKHACPFDWRNYSMYGFLADVRNYSHCTPISEPRGLPDDSEWLNSPHEYAYDRNPMSGQDIPISERETNRQYYSECDYHSHSWLSVKELADFDYEQTFWDRRVTKQRGPNSWKGASLAEEGEGEIITYRKHLGKEYFDNLEILKSLGNPEDVRIVFWFDN